MIEFKLFFALISYYFVMFATPGPNNAMLTASGIKFGLFWFGYLISEIPVYSILSQVDMFFLPALSGMEDFWIIV